ncbi:M48 metallopeptidase family protein [Neobacillus drentensis]
MDYLVVHELAHIIHPTHSEAFCNLVDKIIQKINSFIPLFG